MENTSSLSNGAAPSGRLHTALWIVQILLFLTFGASGVLKLLLPLEKLVEMMVWPGLVPGQLVRANGAAELLGALGMVLPAYTRIKPHLTSWAGYGLLFVMTLAAGFHMSHSGFYMLPANILLGGLAGFVGWGRGSQVPIAPKG